MAVFSASLLISSVPHHPSEITLNMLNHLINVENSCVAKYFVKMMIHLTFFQCSLLKEQHLFKNIIFL